LLAAQAGSEKEILIMWSNTGQLKLRNRTPSAPARRNAFRPRLEALENRLTPAAHTWTGGSPYDALWSEPANWAEGAPTPGESNVSLLFPAAGAAARPFTYNDLSGLAVASIHFTGHDYHVAGNDLILRGDTTITDDGLGTTASTNTIDLNLDQEPAFAGPSAFFDHVYNVAGGFALLEIRGQITGAPVLNVLHKTGPGGLLLDNPLNDYGGETLIDGGGLALGADNAVPPNPCVVADTAFFDLNGHNATLGSLAGAGSVVYPGSPVFPGQPVRTLTTGLDNTSTTFSGVISGAVSLAKVGSGAFMLSAVNTYVGATTLQAGSLVAGIDNAVPPNPCVVASGATLDLNGHNATLGSLAGAGRVLLSIDPTLTTGGDNTSTTFSGVISGVGGLTKVGTGTFTLAGDNTYTGPTTILQGALLVNGSLSSSSAVSVSGGATLGGTGVVGGPIAVGGVFNPGGMGPSQFASGAFTFAAGSTFRVDLNGPLPGGGYDQLNAHGPVDLTAAPELEVALGFIPRVGEKFMILTSTDRITGHFAGHPQGDRFWIGDVRFRIHYSRHSVVLTRIGPSDDGDDQDD
jgi:fibronectin-binding autotransporter adhesin